MIYKDKLLKPTVLKISLVGDVFPAELPFTVGFGIKSQFEIHKGKVWAKRIKSITGESDIVIGNLESPLLKQEERIKETFFGHPDFAKFLKNSGIGIVNIANNHILEHNKNGFNCTKRILSDNNIDFVGNEESGKSNVLYKTINGLKIAVAGFSNVDLHVINNENNFAILTEENVIDSLNEMTSQNVDLKILCFHWGNEYVHIPSIEQRKLAHKFIDAGADIIAGHHSHVIQPYEEYKDGHIFYSLGNFMFDYLHSKMIRIGLAPNIEIDLEKKLSVNLKGVELSHKDTISLMSEKKFSKFYSKINNRYNSFIELPDDLYKKKYLKMLNRNRFHRRLAMKTYVFVEFFKISNTSKIALIKNVNHYYSSLLRKVVFGKK